MLSILISIVLSTILLQKSINGNPININDDNLYQEDTEFFIYLCLMMGICSLICIIYVKIYFSKLFYSFLLGCEWICMLSILLVSILTIYKNLKKPKPYPKIYLFAGFQYYVYSTFF